MGTVYRAYDMSLNRVVAIKILKRELTDDHKFVETFRREIQITSALAHPNIVQVFTFGEFDGHQFLVMEFIDSPTLDDLIVERKRLTEAEVLDVGIGIASGLAFAFEQGELIHRDIKPGNMLFGQDNTPKVVDFGLALTPETTDQFAGEIWGTPFYVSPERLEGEPEDFRSDMYSLGVTLYHALAGRPPFDADTAELVATKHLTSTPLPLKTYAPRITDQTAYAIMRSMARYREHRYSTYQEMIEQLQDAKRRLTTRESNPIIPKPVTAPEPEDTTVRNALVFGLVVSVILLVAILWSMYGSSI